MANFLNTIVVDNTYGPANTNQYLVVPLSGANFNFASLASNGRNLAILSSDQVTPLVCSLRTWGSNVGMRYDQANSILGPAYSTNVPTYAYQACIGPSVGTLGLANDPHTIVGTGNLSDPNPSYGQWDLYDCYNNHVWTYQSPSNDYPMSMHIGDMTGSGDYVIAVGSRLQDHSGIILNPDGSVRWTHTFAANGQSTAPYIRTAAIGQMSTACCVVFGGEWGQLAGFSSTGSLLWGPLTLTEGSGETNPSIQDGLIANLTNSGYPQFYCTQSNLIRQIDGTGTIGWTYTGPGAPTFNYYCIAAGFITSTTYPQQLVAVSASGSTVETGNCGLITVVDHTGALIWSKVTPYPLYSVAVGDVNGDGYAEILVTWGNYGPTVGNYSSGGLLVLDRNGQELASGSFGAPSTNAVYAAYDSSGAAGLSFATDDRWCKRYKFDSAVGASIKTTVPSVAATSTQNIYIAASSNTSNVPALGDYDFTNFAGMTQRVGTWTYSSGSIISSNDGDSANQDSIEATGYTTDAFEFEFTFVKNAQGTGASSDYFAGCIYRANTWGATFPNGFLFQIGSKGHVDLYQVNTAGSIVETLVAATTGPTIATTDTVILRLVCSGTEHSAHYRQNGGPWTQLYWVIDPSGSPLLSAGTISLYNGRGQTTYSNLVLRGIPNSYCGTGPAGPAAIPEIAGYLGATITYIPGPSILMGT